MPSVTLNFTAQQALRIAPAVGRLMSLKDGNGAPRDATEADVKEFLAQHLRSEVESWERREALRLANVTPVEIT